MERRSRRLPLYPLAPHDSGIIKYPRIKRKVIPIPLGHKVKFTISGWDYFGYVQKHMFPMYEFKNTCPYDMRYAIGDFKEKDHSWVISECYITGPNIRRWYDDEDYRNKILSQYE